MKRKDSGNVRDRLLFWLAIAATVIGILFVFDAGYARSLRDHNSPFPRELWIQIASGIIGVWLATRLSKVKSQAWIRWSKIAWVVSFIGLLLCLVPGIGVSMNGASRWIKVPILPQIQPAEFVKVTAVLYLAAALAFRKPWPKKVKRYESIALWMDAVALPKLKRALPFLWVMVAVYLIEDEPDLGTAAVVAASAFVMLYVAGVSRKSLLWGTAIGVLGVGLMLKSEPYRIERFTSHGARWTAEHIDDSAFQTVQSETAMASGGIIGVGIGAGRAKQVLPATTTDFVGATIAEETGLIGSLAILALLSAISLRLLWLAMLVKERFAKLVLVGTGSWIGVQTCVNMMMANALLPPIGIPMPFISSGGSSLLALWIAIGVCQAVLKPQPVKEEEVETRDHRRRNRRTYIPSARSRATVR